MVLKQWEEALCGLIKRLDANGYLSSGKFCSVSLFDREHSVIYLSPGLDDRFHIGDWQLMRPEDAVAVDSEGRQLKEYAPLSSPELETHLAIYRQRPLVSALAHIQPVHAAAFSAAGNDMHPVMVEDVKTMIGGEDGIVRSAPFAGYGSQAYTDHILKALDPDKKAAFMRFNGAFCAEVNAEELYSICTILERQAQMEIYALSLGSIQYIDLDMAIDESIRPKRKTCAK